MKTERLFPADLQGRIEAKIASGDLGRGEIISYQELSERFGASSSDLEFVIQSQVRKGLVERGEERQVRILGLPKAKIESVFQYAQRSKLKPRTVVRDVSVQPANLALAKQLHVPEGWAVFMQVRTRLVDDQVLANQYNFIPYEICPGLEEIDLTCRSFQATLEEVFHTVITRIEETYTLGKPGRDDNAILEVEDDATILIVERMSYSRNNYPLVYADIHVNPAQFHYVEDLWPKATPLVESLI